MWRVNSSLIARRASMAVTASSRMSASRVMPRAMPSMTLFARSYSIGLSKQDVETRVLNVFKAFDKLTPTAKFTTDLGLDSLDTVEVIVAVEEEFGIEIPDEQADEIKSIDDAVNYILAQPEAR